MHIIRGDIQSAVSVDEIKAMGVIEHDEDDAKLAALASAVTAEYCARTSTAFLPETVTVTWDTWSCGVPLSLPIGPLTQDSASTLTATQTNETTGATEAIGTTDMTTRHGNRPTLTVYVTTAGPLTVTYTAGHATAPAHVRTALAMQVMHQYDAQDVETQSRRLAPAYASALHTRTRVSI